MFTSLIFIGIAIVILVIAHRRKILWRGAFFCGLCCLAAVLVPGLTGVYLPKVTSDTPGPQPAESSGLLPIPGVGTFRNPDFVDAGYYCSSPVYYFMEKTAEGKYEPGYIYADETTIDEDAPEHTAYIEDIHISLAPSDVTFINWVFHSTREEYVLHLPPGTPLPQLDNDNNVDDLLR
ncbi:MAG: hypothetical protein WBL37_08750 [Dehalococcoidales bacterium]|jgi:hypothetical protein